MGKTSYVNVGLKPNKKLMLFAYHTPTSYDIAICTKLANELGPHPA